MKGGRCEECCGDGYKTIEMHFLPDVYIVCEQCNGQRYNEETLNISYKGKNIADILNMTVSEAILFFKNFPKINQILKTLESVGLSYIRLGQSATTFSGGEAQRCKLAKELAKKTTTNNLYILDEPTTGLHLADIKKLLESLIQIRDKDNTILIIEHNIDLIKACDYLIDLGPEGGEKGGEIIAKGTPKQVAKVKASYTGRYL